MGTRRFGAFRVGSDMAGRAPVNGALDVASSWFQPKFPSG